MLNFGSTNLLAGFNNNLSGGVFKLASGASLLTTGGSFTNAGTFTISTGTTFTIGGSGFNYTQTAGSTTVAGTLTSTSLGTVNLDAGTLTGAGTIGDNLMDDSTLDPGTSAAKTGKLTVSDTYTQDAGGALNIQINGATPVTKYDQLKVTGTAHAGRHAEYRPGQRFTPTVGAEVHDPDGLVGDRSVRHSQRAGDQQQRAFHDHLQCGQRGADGSQLDHCRPRVPA